MKNTAEINHPVFGKLVRTDRDRLLAFREFPHFKQFVWPGPPDGKPLIEYLDKNDRKLVESWKSPSSELAAICRNGQVHSSLRSLGVFEMRVDVTDDGLPTRPQEAAYRHFSDNEQTVCAAVVDALMRYYKFVRQAMPGEFDHLAADRRPDNPSAAEFARICRFDKMIVCQGVANGFSPLSLRWDPVWDQEHGLGTIVFQGQVIMIGPDTFDFLAFPEAVVVQSGEHTWMTEKETDAVTAFLASYEPEGEADE